MFQCVLMILSPYLTLAGATLTISYRKQILPNYDHSAFSISLIAAIIFIAEA